LKALAQQINVELNCSVHDDRSATYVCAESDCLSKDQYALCDFCLDLHPRSHKTHHKSFIDPISFTDRLKEAVKLQTSKEVQDIEKIQTIYEESITDITQCLTKNCERTINWLKQLYQSERLITINEKFAKPLSDNPKDDTFTKKYLIDFSTSYTEFQQFLQSLPTKKLQVEMLSSSLSGKLTSLRLKIDEELKEQGLGVEKMFHTTSNNKQKHTKPNSLQVDHVQDTKVTPKVTPNVTPNNKPKKTKLVLTQIDNIPDFTIMNPVETPPMEIEHTEHKKKPERMLEDMDPNNLYCLCKKPYTGEFMIACERCDAWYHPECVQFPFNHNEQVNKVTRVKWYCPYCKPKTRKNPFATKGNQLEPKLRKKKKKESGQVGSAGKSC